MEILLELFAVILEFVFEVIFSYLFEVGESEFEFKGGGPAIWFLIYLILGVTLGGISLLLFKSHFIQDDYLRTFSLFITPSLVGLMTGFRGKRRQKKGQSPIRIDSFSNGFIFSFSFGLVRYMLAS